MTETRDDEVQILSRVACLRCPDLETENKRLKKMLEELTPQGSEFHNDPERCVAYIKDHMKGTLRFAKKNKRLREALEEIALFTCSEPTERIIEEALKQRE